MQMKKLLDIFEDDANTSYLDSLITLNHALTAVMTALEEINANYPEDIVGTIFEASSSECRRIVFFQEGVQETIAEESAGYDR
jgi:hypothetical protein